MLFEESRAENVGWLDVMSQKTVRLDVVYMGKKSTIVVADGACTGGISEWIGFRK